MHEIKKMFDYTKEQAEKARAIEESKKAQLRKIQEDNLKVAMLKKNLKEQVHIGDSLKEKDLVDSGAFGNKNQEVR